jgi:tetratricopeptide (TPR) repeat protein/tRNA A-37 threonylcarbamoyl transferase component Bud32
MPVERNQTLSHYRLIEKIGEGGMGVVWKAEDTVLGRTVAIKVLPADHARDEKRRQMFFDEARLASSLSEAHIVQVHEFGHEGDLDFIVMEYVEGKPLNKVLHGRPMPSEKVAEIGQQVARALSKAHRKGLIHRDLKPANILITPDGDAKVVDFGLATLIPQLDFDSGSAVLTRSIGEKAVGSTEKDEDVTVAGTIPYMSPEQVRGEKMDLRSDIFSLGCVLYEMTTGQRPFRGATNKDVVSEVLKSRPKPVHQAVADVPLELDRIITKTLSARPGDRYQNTEDLAVDLKRLGRDLESGSSPSYEELARVVRPNRRWVGMAATVGVLVVAAIAWFGVFRSGTAVSPNTVLVLPMEVRGQEEGAEYVGRAFAEAIVSNLVQAKGLNVLAVPDTGELSGNGSQNRARTARDRGAGRLITGSVTREGEAVNASLSLVDATKNSVIWASQDESVDGDLSKLASSLARELAGQLGTSLGSYYDHPVDNPIGSPEFLASPDLFETVGAIRRNETPNALAASKRLVAAFPNEPDALYLRAAALSIVIWGSEAPSPEWKEWEKNLIAIDRVDPNSPWDEFQRAITMANNPIVFGEDNYKKAYELYSEILAREDLVPSARAIVLVFRGAVLRYMGDTSASLANLEEALRLAPTLPLAHSEMSGTLVDLDRLDEAVERVRQAVALNPTDFNIQTYLAFVLTRNEQLGEALKHGRLAVELGPDNYKNHWVLGDIYWELEKWKEAALHYGKAYELSPEPYYCAMKAAVLQKEGKEEEAKKAATEAASLPETEGGASGLAIYHALVGDRDQALRYLRRTCELDVNPSVNEVEHLRRDMPSLNGDPEFEAIIAEYEKRIEAHRESFSPE